MVYCGSLRLWIRHGHLFSDSGYSTQCRSRSVVDPGQECRGVRPLEQRDVFHNTDSTRCSNPPNPSGREYNHNVNSNLYLDRCACSHMVLFVGRRSNRE